jgi:sec-independent protein translocase protein TatA
MGPFGFQEIIFIFIAALLIFGPKKLPEIGKTIGKGMREFKKATDDLKSNWEDHIRDPESPVHDLKEAIHEVKADLEASTNEITADLQADVHAIKTEVEAATDLEDKPPVSAPEAETKPDAHTH